MSFSEWKSKINENLWKVRQRMELYEAKTVHGFLSAMMFWPVFQAAQHNDQLALTTLAATLSGIGANLVANSLDTWKNKIANEADAVRVIESDLIGSDTLRAELVHVLNKMEIIPEVRKGMKKDELIWFDTKVEIENEWDEESWKKLKPFINKGLYVHNENVKVKKQININEIKGNPKF